jgi:hypothetical protein
MKFNSYRQSLFDFGVTLLKIAMEERENVERQNNKQLQGLLKILPVATKNNLYPNVGNVLQMYDHECLSVLKQNIFVPGNVKENFLYLQDVDCFLNERGPAILWNVNVKLSLCSQ